MNKELTKEETEEYYNKLWLENKELIQENMNKLSMERFELELELVDKNKEIERLHSIIKEAKKYIEEHIEWEVDGEEGIDYTAWINFKGTSYEYFVKELLEILDKENKE